MYGREQQKKPTQTHFAGCRVTVKILEWSEKKPPPEIQEGSDVSGQIKHPHKTLL